MSHTCYDCRMVTVAVRDLRNNTAQVVEQARAGQPVVLTSRGEPVARIVPLEPARRPFLTAEDLLAIPRADAGLRADLEALTSDDDTAALGPIL